MDTVSVVGIALQVSTRQASGQAQQPEYPQICSMAGSRRPSSKAHRPGVCQIRAGLQDSIKVLSSWHRS